MFFKRLFSFSSNKDILFYENKLYKIYSGMQDGKKVVKFIMSQDIKQYECLRKIRHDNILHPLKLNVKSKSIVSQYLMPFDLIYKENTIEFKKYFFLCLAKALDFLHKNCSIVHNNIVSTSLFFNEDCKIVLGGFERSYKSTSFDCDNTQFSNLLYKYTGINSCIEDFISNQGFTNTFFSDNEIFFFGFASHQMETKIDFIRNIKSNVDELVNIYKFRIIFFFIQDLENESPKEYKEEILDFILFLELDDYNEIIEMLFKILDSNVRFYLLKHSNRYLPKVKTLDSITKSLLLGIKCKNKSLRSETFKFVNDNHSKLSEEAQIDVLTTAHDFISDEKGFELVLEYINNSKPIFKQSDIVYKILKSYLVNSKNKEKTIDTIQVFYGTFNKYKVSTELLPILCTNLIDEHLQKKTFSLIDCILKDLKDHKEQIVSKEWSFDKVKDFFHRKEKNETVNKTISPKLNAKEDDWDDDW